MEERLPWQGTHTAQWLAHSQTLMIPQSFPPLNVLLLHSGRSRVKGFGFFFFLVTRHLLSAVYGR